MKFACVLLLLMMSGLAKSQDRGEETLQWASAIRDRIYSNWNPPPSGDFSRYAPCMVIITMQSDGPVMEISVEPPCSSVEPLSDALQRAVLRSDPLPVPRDPSVFVPRIMFTFRE